MMDSSTSSSLRFIEPKKEIHDEFDLEKFKASKACNEILKFVQDCTNSCVGLSILDEGIKVSIFVTNFQNFMNKLFELVVETPPLSQPMRFGNKAFRDWHEKMKNAADVFLNDSLPNDLISAKIELLPYIFDMFGNPTRIDYGTGHELNFAIFFLLIQKLSILDEADNASIVLRAFVSYLKLMRKLQEDYMLEPAGSHGVWGLDDYHCLLFLWGSAQLSRSSEISPQSIHEDEVLKEYSNEYLYLEGISFIKKLKFRAPFAETSPMLNDISYMGDWARICSGLMRLFQGEVLYKFPVIQHVLFGSLLASDWKNSK